MDAAKHTPGPWFMVDDHAHRACLHIRTGAGEFDSDVASVYEAPGEPGQQDEDGKWQNDPVRIANARLIAAAPELLANLQFAVKLMRPIFGGSAQVEHMESVIAKATGSAA